MKAVARLVILNLRLSYRVKIAFFFHFIFPLLMTFAYFGIFAHGNPLEVAGMMGPLISLTVMTDALLMAGMRSAEMRERDMFRQFHLTPIRASQLVLSDIILGYLTFAPVVVLEFAIAVSIYRMPLAGSYLAIVVISTLGFLALASLGILLSSVVNTGQEASVITQLLFLLLILLSGTTMPLVKLPRIVQYLAVFTPPALMIVPTDGIILHGDHLSQHLPEILTLLVSFLTAFAVAILVFRWEKDEKVTPAARLKALAALLPLVVLGIVFSMNPKAHRWFPFPSQQTPRSAPANQ